MQGREARNKHVRIFNLMHDKSGSPEKRDYEMNSAQMLAGQYRNIYVDIFLTLY